MRHCMTLLGMVALLPLLLVAPSTFAQSVAPGPTIVYQARYAVAQPPAHADLYMAVAEQAPGHGTPVHTHSGQAINIVLDGTLTKNPNSTKQSLHAGDSWTDLPGEVHQITNIDPTTKAHSFAVFLIPQGAPLTTVVGGGSSNVIPAVTTAQAKFTVAGVPPQPDLVLFVLDFAPGARTPPHKHGGQAFNLVMTGTFVAQENGTSQTFQPGQGWDEVTDQAHTVINTSQTTARLLVAFLVPHSAPVTTVEVSPSAAVPVQPKSGCMYVAATQHNLCAGFRAYWNQFGGLATYGWPISEEFVVNGMTVQDFERARFEWQPGRAPQHFDVMLGLLGDELTANRRAAGEAPFQGTAAHTAASCTYVAATQHNLCAGFRAYWNQFGGPATYGWPISEEFVEQGHTVQYFERARFEWQPGMAPQHFDVLLGRVGSEVIAPGGP